MRISDWSSDVCSSDLLSRSAIRRWRTPAARLGRDSYRPATLDKVKDELYALGPWDFEPPSDLIATERVRVGDTLSAYAKKHYGDAELWPDIYGANLDRSEAQTSELQSLMRISYAVFCLKTKKYN